MYSLTARVRLLSHCLETISKNFIIIRFTQNSTRVIKIHVTLSFSNHFLGTRIYANDI